MVLNELQAKESQNEKNPMMPNTFPEKRKMPRQETNSRLAALYSLLCTLLSSAQRQTRKCHRKLMNMPTSEFAML